MSLFFLFTGLLLFHVALTSAVDVRELSIDEYINFVNPPPLHKFQSKHGDNILCVKFSDQISVKYAHDNITKGLENILNVKFSTQNISNFDSGRGDNSKVGIKSECPEDTVAIREIKREDVERAGSVRRFLDSRGRKDSMPGYYIEYAYGRYDASDDPIFEISARLNVWSPKVAPDGNFSEGALWIYNTRKSNDSNVETLEEIEVGWIVYPERYGDARPRFFTHWTKDGYNGTTGCYDLDCPGFVTSASSSSPGAPVYPVSVPGGNQSSFLLSVKKDQDGWSLYVEGQLIGPTHCSLRFLLKVLFRWILEGQLVIPPNPWVCP